MIVPQSVADSLLWIIEGLLLPLALFWRLRPPKHWWGHLLIAAAMLGCFLGGFRVDGIGSPVAIVKIDAAGHVEKVRGHLMFGERYALQNGTQVRIEPAESRFRCVIVNDSAKVLRIEAQQYATSSAFALPTGEPETIAPFTVKADGPSLDAIGPDEQLPASTTGPLNETFLFHLTWDP